VQAPICASQRDRKLLALLSPHVPLPLVAAPGCDAATLASLLTRHWPRAMGQKRKITVARKARGRMQEVTKYPAILRNRAVVFATFFPERHVRLLGCARAARRILPVQEQQPNLRIEL
jgi:hypothetical protein